MFGMSFGSTAPQPSAQREQLAQNEEIAISLTDAGIVGDANELTAEDYSAINARMKVIESRIHINKDVAAVLAYVDRKIATEKTAGNAAAEQTYVSKITPDIISAVVDPSLAGNTEFLQTILNASLQKYNSGSYVAFSDALLEAVREREAALAATPTVAGKIDGQDNVIQPSDEQLLH